MPIDPSLLPPPASPDDPSASCDGALPAPYGSTPHGSTPYGSTPHLGHTALFAALVCVSALLVGLTFGIVLRHLAPHLHEPLDQMETDPRLVVPVEALLYGLAGSASFVIFPLLWHRSFAEGVHWRREAVRRWWAPVLIGVVTSVSVQLLSNFLPIPKELPIDRFFTNPTGVWLIAVFGVTVAPAFEELAFRGFLMPSLATAWDSVAAKLGAGRQAGAWGDAAEHGVRDGMEEWQARAAVPRPASLSAFDDPQWSRPAVVFSILVTSVGFALLHGAQLAHSLAPLAVLFAVSVVLCLTRLRFHSLAASTLVHSTYNATIFVLLFVGTGGFRHLDKLGQ
jgi:membrane protease YdiL (CAAX protease family)